MAAPPAWTTVPAQEDSGWEVYRPAPPPHVAPKPRAAPAAVPAPTPRPQHAAPAHPTTRAEHRKRTRPPAMRVVVKPEPTGAVLTVPRAPGTPGYASALVLAALVTAIACLAFASAPTSKLRWRRGAFFVADNRVGITSAGGACLLAAAILFVLARG